MGQNCSACYRKNKTCLNFAVFAVAEVFCNKCGRYFYGQNCFEAHRRGSKSVCSKFKKCAEFCKVYEVSKKKKHICYEYNCPNCKQTVMWDHQCYTQPLEDYRFLIEQKEQGPEEEENLLPQPEEEENNEEKEEPLVCIIDFECSTNEEKELRNTV